MRVWHIFKKDFKLLWALAVTGAVGQLLLAWLVYQSQHAAGDGREAVAAVLTLGLLVVMSLSVVLAVQHEALSSIRQDWLVRPIGRSDLLLAKLLFVVLVIHAPILVGGVMRGLAEGFSFGDALSAGLLSSLQIALLFSLPLTAIAALTKSATEAIITALIAFFLIMLVRVVFSHSPTGDSGIAWVWRSAGHLILLGSIVAVLLLQYRRRRTRQARWLFIMGILLFMLARTLPWAPAYAIQQAVAPNPEARIGTAIHYGTPSGAVLDRPTRRLVAGDDKPDPPHDSIDVVKLSLPLTITGLAAGALLHIDRMTFEIHDAGGRELYSGNGDSVDFSAQSGPHDPTYLGHAVHVPRAVYERAGGAGVTLQLHYWFTIFQSHTLMPFPATNGEFDAPPMGHCLSRANETGTSIDLRCFKPGALPACTSAALLNPAGNLSNPDVFDCTVDYTPRWLDFSAEPIDHSHSVLPLRAPADARILITVYTPVAHFAQALHVPNVRMSDLQESLP